MYWSRLRIFLLLMTLGMVVLTGRLVQLQWADAETYRNEAEANLVKPTRLLETRRGAILDRSGLVLAEDVPRFDLSCYYPFLAARDEAFVRRKAAREGRSVEQVRREMADLWIPDDRLRRLRPAELSDTAFLESLSGLWEELAEATGVGIEAIDRRREDILRRVTSWGDRVRRAQGRDIPIREETYLAPGSVPHVLVEGISEPAKAVVTELQRRYPFLLMEGHAERRYRYGDVATHVVGYMAEVARRDVRQCPDGSPPVTFADELRAYRLGDEYGMTGIEAGMESVLRGARGIERRRRDGTVLEREPPESGRDVHLTLDVPFQTEVEALIDRPSNLPPHYGPSRGAAVVIDLATGGFLALASTPRYDANAFFAEYPDLVAEGAGRPLRHRAVAAQLSLGSIFKAATATAALQEGTLRPDTTFHCDGVLDPRHPRRFRCLGSHGRIAVERAIKVSCNVFFYKTGLKLGSDRLVEWGRRFGFGRPVGLDLAVRTDEGLVPAEGDGWLPDRMDPRLLAIGQGELIVTPLQVARLYALIATGGTMPEVHLVASPRAEPVRRVDLSLDPRHVGRVRRALRKVVNESGGTGYERVRSPRVAIAGKTGSAETSGPRPTHSWFAGFAPADRPRIAFAVVFEYAGHGSVVAGPVARQIVETALRHGIITSDGRTARRPEADSR